jgi:putative colanic acid biosynthesis glycosyltransferase
MPKLLQINSVLNTGSTGRVVEQIGQFVLSKGWESYVAYGRISNVSASRSIRIGGKIDIAIHGVKSRLFDKHGLGSVSATKSFLGEIQKINPDIIHLHNIHGYYINYSILFAHLAHANIPVVWTFHDCWPLTGHCSYFSDIECIKWKVECHICPKKKYYPTSLFIDNSCNNYKLKRHFFTSLSNMTIVSVSQWLGGIIKESYLSEFPIHVINNGIDLKTFSPKTGHLELKKKYGIAGRDILLGVATVWDARKGLEDYYSLSKILPDKYTIVLVGLSEKQKKHLPPNIIGIKRIEVVKDLAEIYSVADIVLNLSYQETFGMTTVEGFACGTPGIVYNCTASPELITKGTGIIVDAGNIEQLVGAIEIIRSNGKEYYSENCRKRAERFYDKQKRYNEYFQLYEAILKK